MLVSVPALIFNIPSKADPLQRRMKVKQEVLKGNASV
jgi:hypothetical protein